MADQEEKQKIVEIMRQNKAALGFLFGSVARGTAGPLSDIDFAVAFGRKVSDEERRDRIEEIRGGLEEIYGIDKVDVVDLNKLDKPALMHEIILDEGRLLFCDDPEIEKFLARKALVEFEDTRYMRDVQSYVLRNLLAKQI